MSGRGPVNIHQTTLRVERELWRAQSANVYGRSSELWFARRAVSPIESATNGALRLFDAFDVCATYTKSRRRLELAASVTPDLVSSQGRSQEGVQNPPPL